MQDNKCSNGYAGQLKVDIKGGKGPFQYNWSTASWTDVTSPTLQPGTYSVSVTDAAGQRASSTAVLSSPTPIVLSLELIQPADVNLSNGQAQVKATGGKSPYTYV